MWEGLRAEGLNSLSMSEVRQMLRDVAWREAVDSWREEARSHSKLAELQKLIEKGYEAQCVEVKRRAEKREEDHGTTEGWYCSVGG